MISKKKRTMLEKVHEEGFDFHVYGAETDVYRKGRCLGTIIGMKEKSGRHCFRLGCDRRDDPRTYRGRVKAAEALQIIDGLKREAKKRRWTVEDVIIHSWDDKPHASPKQSRD